MDLTGVLLRYHPSYFAHQPVMKFWATTIPNYIAGLQKYIEYMNPDALFLLMLPPRGVLQMYGYMDWLMDGWIHR